MTTAAVPKIGPGGMFPRGVPRGSLVGRIAYRPRAYSLQAVRKTLLLLSALLLTVGACATPQPTGIVRDPAPEVGHLSLPDADGVDTAFVGPEGGYLIVYFGYTHCPDICPTTMADFRSALAEIGDDAGRFTVGVITVDPDRDSASELQHYVNVFFSDGIAFRTEDATALRAVADGFGADYLVETNEAGEIEVGHTAYLYAVDSQGRIRLQWPFGALPEDIAHDLEILIDQL